MADAGDALAEVADESDDTAVPYMYNISDTPNNVLDAPDNIRDVPAGVDITHMLTLLT